MTESLPDQLADFRAGWHARVPEKMKTAMQAQIAHLGASGIANHAKQVGDRAPEVKLPHQTGQAFGVADRLSKVL
jgi:hypothetical protein